MLEKLKKEVYEANLNLVKYNLIDLTWGNVSGIDRNSGLVVIKPSGVDYAKLKVQDLVVVDLYTGKIVEGNLNPSSDLPTHLELYKSFPDIGGVTHTHSKYATSFAQAKKMIPAFGTTHADHFYGEIPCTRPLTIEEINTDYERNTGLVIKETFSSIDYNAIPSVLVASHGVFSWGKNALKSVENALVAERCAEMAYLTMALGNIETVSQSLLDKHYFRKHGKNAYYGQKESSYNDKVASITENVKVCDCGRVHTVTLKKFLMEKNALSRIGEVVNFLGDYKNVVMVCDENTYRVAGCTVENFVKLKQKIVLDPNGLHADENSVYLVEELLDSSCDLLLAVGSGTIHDITRYVAYEKGLQFVSVPTAPSVDGYVSSVCAMTWKGVKRTLTAISPLALVADSDVITGAPLKMISSGIGDMLGKYTALFDWKISSILTGEYYCDYVASLMQSALEQVVSNIEKIKTRDIHAIESLTYGLVLSGLVMQMTGNSRPASGAEHHISHLIEMGIVSKNNTALHGEKVGVATVLVLKKYHQATKHHLTESDIIDYDYNYNGFIKEKFSSLSDEIIKENNPDPLKKVSVSALLEKWEDICAYAKVFLPSENFVKDILDDLDA
ncbi:MAG: L-ribulose-5-phosphate 4-epimerase AraD [Clostridia bacterium]|nr:L-ribulose-5-phosphate 4-epimerase AraD [Clostridia bacterium]